jgi:hypothetical protein
MAHSVCCSFVRRAIASVIRPIETSAKLERRPPARRDSIVAQICNLPYRRIAFCESRIFVRQSRKRTLCRLQIGDTADYKSALRPRRSGGRRSDAFYRNLQHGCTHRHGSYHWPPSVLKLEVSGRSIGAVGIAPKVVGQVRWQGRPIREHRLPACPLIQFFSGHPL